MYLKGIYGEVEIEGGNQADSYSRRDNTGRKKF